MSLPNPQPGHVLRYAYLWTHEFDQGLEEGRKDRPVAVVMTVKTEDGATRVAVVPITHTPPDDANAAIEIPPAIKAMLHLDDARSWIAVTEINVFVWPGPDLRPVDRGGAAEFIYGALPERFFRTVRDRLVANMRAGSVRQVPRTE